MRRALLVVVAAVIAILAWPGAGSAALSCGLPEAQPTWIDFADSSVSFWRERFARPGVVIGTGGAGARRGSAGGRSGHRSLGHVPAQARRHTVRSSRSGVDREASRRALRLRGLGLRLRDAADRSERALGRVAADTADSDRRALPGERSSLRQPARRARWTTGAPRVERAVHRRRRGDVVEVGRRGIRSRPRELRERESHLAGRAGRRFAAAPGSLPAVCGEAARDRGSGLAHRDHDRVPDGAWHGWPRGAEAALALVRRREVAGARRPPGRARVQAGASVVVGLGAARCTIERS